MLKARVSAGDKAGIPALTRAYGRRALRPQKTPPGDASCQTALSRPEAGLDAFLFMR